MSVFWKTQQTSEYNKKEADLQIKENKLVVTSGERAMKVAHPFLTLCDPIDYTVCGILQARILEWVAFPFRKREVRAKIQVAD